MFVSRHLFFGIILSALLFILFPSLGFLPILIVFLSSVLIDTDHYLYYIFIKKDLSLKNAYLWYMQRWKHFNASPMSERKKCYAGFFMFHGIEWLVILFLMWNYVSPCFLYVFMGFLFHFCLDTPDEIIKKGTVDKISLIWNYYRFRKLNH